jgi:zeta-carotene desaturase
MEAVVVRALVIKERNATVRCMPGHSKFRPGQVTPVPNLFLAGDWTDTGWPSTMEGAVRSGILAANQVVESSDKTQMNFV